MRDWFAHLAAVISRAVGTYWAFLTALLVIVIWAASGPLFNFSDTWQLVINTSTTIVTFLMVFLIQNTQNREARATQLKLDELIRSIDQASDRLIDIEEGHEEDLVRLEASYRRQAELARATLTQQDETAEDDSGKMAQSSETTHDVSQADRVHG